MTVRTKTISLVRMLVSPATIFLAVYPLLDVLAPLYPKVGLVGFAWILCVYGCLGILAFISLKELVQRAREERSWLTVSMVAAWFLFLVAAAIPARLMSDENIFQFGCPLVVFRELEDYGFTTQCFIGYPNRSFVLQALSVMLLGVSPFAANIGASILLFPGFILFAHALRILTERARSSDLIAALALALLFSCTVLLRIIYYHDQTTHPFALTLSFIGLAVLAVWRERRFALFTLLALVLVSTAMYPPVLAVNALLALFLAWAVIKKRLPKGGVWLACLTVPLAVFSFIQTLAYRLDIRFGVDSYNVEHLSERLEALFNFIIFQNNGFVYAEPVLHLIFLGCVTLGLIGVFGRIVWVFSVWAVVVIFASFFMGGMSPELAWWQMTGMHRAVPIFAFLVLLVANGLSKRIEHYRLTIGAKVVVAAVVIIPGIRAVVRQPIPLLPPLSYRVWQVAERNTPLGVKPEPTLMTRNDIAVLGEIPKHYLYLNLDRTFVYYSGTCLPTEPVPPYTLVITMDDAVCAANPSRDGFQEVASWREPAIGGWVYSDITIRVYQAMPRS